MLTIAFEMTPLYSSLATVLLAVGGAALCAYFHARGYAKAERVTHAVFAGLRAGVKDLSLGSDQVASLEDAIQEAAKDYGQHAQDEVDDHLGDGLASTTPAPGAPK